MQMVIRALKDLHQKFKKKLYFEMKLYMQLIPLTQLISLIIMKKSLSPKMTNATKNAHPLKN